MCRGGRLGSEQHRTVIIGLSYAEKKACHVQLTIVNLHRLFQFVSLAKRSFSVTAGSLCFSFLECPGTKGRAALPVEAALGARRDLKAPPCAAKLALNSPVPPLPLHSALPSAHHAHPGRGGVPVPPLGRVPVPAAAAVPSAGAGAGRARGPGLGSAPGAERAGLAVGKLLGLLRAAPSAAAGPRKGRDPAGSDGTMGHPRPRGPEVGAGGCGRGGAPGWAPGPGQCRDFSAGRLFSSESPARALCRAGFAAGRCLSPVGHTRDGLRVFRAVKWVGSGRCGPALWSARPPGLGSSAMR